MIYLFDIDGTLLLSGGAGLVALERAFVELHGIAGAFGAVQPAGMTDPVIVEEAFDAAFGRPATPEEMRSLLERYLVHLPVALEQATGYRLLRGVPSALVALEGAGHLLALATGNIREAARHKLARGGIEGFFRCGGYGSDHRERTRIVALAAERALALRGRREAPGEVVVVGDTPRDVMAARENGFVAVAVSSGTVSRVSLEDARPDRLIESLDELLV